MAATREEFVDASDQLRIAVYDLKAIDEQVATLSVSVGDLPLSEAAAKVSRGA